MSDSPMEDAVRAFHEKFGFETGKSFICMDKRPNPAIRTTAVSLLGMARTAENVALEMQRQGDERLYRIALLAEEFGEACAAMLDRDRVALADALGDMLYVVIGTAVTYNIPIEDVFWEIHRSNMTKERPSNDPRMRDKGDNYSPPNIEDLIK